MKLGFIIDNKKCIGCHACTVACKAEHDVPIGVNRTWVKYIEKGSFPNARRLFSVMRCNHCDDAPCVDICPTSALYSRSDGIVDFNNERCIGCKSCMQACPYDALYIDPNTETAAKCNYCSHRVENSLEPACVVVCPTEAIISGDMDNPDSKISKTLAREQTTSRKIEKGTRPKLFYIEGDKNSLTPIETMPHNDYMWSEQSKGVGHFANSNSSNHTIIDEKGLPSSHKILEEDEEKVFVPQSRDPFSMLKKAKEVIRENVKRVYDSPSKGVKWGWEVTAYVVAKAFSAGVFFLAFLFNLIVGIDRHSLLMTVFTSLFFLGLTGAFLIKDLDQPKRFLYVLMRPHFKSWLVKGACIITLYSALLSVWIASYFFFPQLSNLIAFINLPIAILLAVYTAFLFAQAKGRDFWQSPLLIFHMMNHSILGGASLLILMSFLGWIDFRFMPFWAVSLIVGIVQHLILLVIERYMPHSTRDTEKTVEIIFSGRYKNHLRYGVILLGSLVPLVLVLLNILVPLGLILASLLAIIGMIISTHLWIKAPQLIPLS